MNDEIVSELSNLCLRTVNALSSDNCREMNQRQKKKKVFKASENNKNSRNSHF